MSWKWITVNSRLAKGIKLINALTRKKFKLIVYRITNCGNEEAFSVDELKKLGETLKLNEENIQLLVQSISYILKQSAKVVLRPTDLQKHLVDNLNLDAEKSQEFTNLWSEETKKDLGDFENRMKLEDVAWEQNIEIANQICNKQNMSVTRIQLKLSEAADRSKKRNITVELDKEELLKLYSTLEVIQIKLDNLQMLK